MKGLVTSIQSMCYDDGPGLRTTVFLKGCPLRCFWCHNPESLEKRCHVAWYAAKCVGCTSCVKNCPTGARKKVGEFPDADVCTVCGECVQICPAYALEMIGTEWEADKLVAYLERDRNYFESSGGGVTFSGGEPLMQWKFVLECIKLLKEKGIHTAIETSGFASKEVFDEVIDVVDLVIMDLKHHDNTIHRSVTGVENGKILENFYGLAETGKKCIIRTPVIPGVNDTQEDIRKIAEIAAMARGLIYYELMPYHDLGSGKLESLGMKYKQEMKLIPPSGEQMDSLRTAARSVGIKVK